MDCFVTAELGLRTPTVSATMPPRIPREVPNAHLERFSRHRRYRVGTRRRSCATLPDPRKDFAPIGLIGNAPNSLVVHPSFPAKTVAELIAYAKANPGKVNFGSAGAGTASHITGEYFARSAGITLVHIPYKGTGPALTDLLGGHIPMAVAPIPASHSNVAAGKLRALAVTSPTRSGLLPDVPTVAEAGIPGFDASLYYCPPPPAATPRPIIDKLNKALRDALASDEVKRQLGNDGTDITPGTPEDYGDFIDKDEKKWAQLVKTSGVEPE